MHMYNRISKRPKN